MQKIGFLGMGVMGLPMAKNVVQKCGLPVLGYDVVQQQMDAFREAGGIPVSDPAEIYKACDVILQILPTHPIIRNSVEQAIQYGKPGNVIVDLSSTAPDIILELYQQAKDAGMFLLPGCAEPFAPKTVRATMGACFRLPVWEGKLEDLLPRLARAGLPLYATALGEDTQDIRTLPLGRAAVVIGSEGRGVSPAVLAASEKTLQIPMTERCESLNAAAAGTVVLWQMGFGPVG